MDTVVTQQVAVRKDIHLTNSSQIFANFDKTGEPSPECCRLQDRGTLICSFLEIPGDGLQSGRWDMSENAFGVIVRVFYRDGNALWADFENRSEVREFDQVIDSLPPINQIAWPE